MTAITITEHMVTEIFMIWNEDVKNHPEKYREYDDLEERSKAQAKHFMKICEQIS